MSWEQLKATIDEQREAEREDERTPPVACPIDGEVLDERPDGTRNCPLGNYRWP